MREYDVIVIGAGHAGIEASLACARLGMKTAVFTITLDNIGVMSCNPSVGGPAKSHLVKEVDALGGEMGRNMDKSFVQMRILNLSEYGISYMVSFGYRDEEQPVKTRQNLSEVFEIIE